MNVFLSVDGSPYTHRMLGYVAAHDELFGPGTHFTVFTAVPSVPARAASFLSREVLDEHYRDEAEKVLAPVRAFAAQKGWDVRVLHAHGHAPEAIAAAVEREKPALIVMGTHGHSALGNLVLGSVANGVLARCRLPVLLVP